MEILVLFWVLLFGIGTAVTMHDKGYRGGSVAGSFILGAVLGPIGLLFALLSSPAPGALANDTIGGASKACPYCLSVIPAAAIACRYCQRSIPTAG